MVKEKFTVVADYSRSLEDLIVAGSYDYVNPEIAKVSFQPFEGERGRKKKFFKLYYFFGEDLQFDDAIGEMKKDGSRPAIHQELLVLGETYPEIQRQFPIIALGTICFNCDGYRCVVELWGDSEKRGLDLVWYDGDWRGHYYFLGVLR